jgi:hypothetical protein
MPDTVPATSSTAGSRVLAATTVHTNICLRRCRTGFGVILIREAFLADAIDNVLAQAALGLRAHRTGGVRRDVAHTRRLHHILAT